MDNLKAERRQNVKALPPRPDASSVKRVCKKPVAKTPPPRPPRPTLKKSISIPVKEKRQEEEKGQEVDAPPLTPLTTSKELHHGSSFHKPSKKEPPPPPPPQDETSVVPLHTPRRAVVAFDFPCSEPGDLGLLKNERLVVTATVGSEWLFGYRSDEPTVQGIFPTSVIKFFEKENTQQPVDLQRFPSPRRATTLFEFTSDVEGDLSFCKGQEIIVTGQVGPDWLVGSLAGKKPGIFPRAFCSFSMEIKRDSDSCNTSDKVDTLRTPTPRRSGTPTFNTEEQPRRTDTETRSNVPQSTSGCGCIIS